MQLCCENPAAIFKIKNKGHIKEGYDADLAIIDLSMKKEVKNNEPEKIEEIGWFFLNNLPEPLHSGFQFTFTTYRKHFEKYIYPEV